MKSHRIEQASELILREVSQLIHETLPEELGIVSVTFVDLSPDFKNATIYVSALNKDAEKDVLVELENRTKEIQLALGKKLTWRYTPKLSFKIDSGGDKVDRVEKLFGEIEK